MADVKDLLIRMSLDTSSFKRNIQDAKGELRALKAEYKAAASEDDLAQSGEKMLSNLQKQKSAAEALTREYQRGMEEIEKKLAGETNTQKKLRYEKDLQNLRTELAHAEEDVNKLDAAIGSLKMDNFIAQAERVAGIFSNLRTGLGPITDWMGGAADSADEAFVTRETARVSGTKSFEGATEEQLNALDKTVKRLITTELPVLYQEMYGILGIAGQNGVDILDADKFATVMAKLSVATDMTASAGSQTMAQFVNLTEGTYDNLDKIGSALVALGNNSATSESAIMEMAHKAASGLHQVGMSSADILGVSAAISSMGIESQAGGTAVSKLAKQMDEASRVGGQAKETLLNAWGDESITSIYDLYAHMDQVSSAEGWKSLATSLGMTMSDTKNLMNAALAAERFSEAMGMSAEEFSAGWQASPAQMLLEFFTALGSMGGTDMEDNMLWTMDALGITEVRLSNMVRALSGNYELYARMIALANEAYAEGTAMDEEAGRAFSTYESQRTLNQNKQENAMEAMGETVAEMRQPFADFFADLQQWYAEWPDWAQTAVAGVNEASGRLGDTIKTLGELSFSLSSIAKAAKEIGDTSVAQWIFKGVSKASGAVGAAAAAAAPAVALPAATIAIGAALDKSSTEKNWGEYNRAQEKLPELIGQAAEERDAYQQMLSDLSQAMDAAWHGEPTEEIGGGAAPIKEFFRQNANALLTAMPDLSFWNAASFYADLEGGLDAAEIERIISGMEFADQWFDLGNEAVTSLAQAISTREVEISGAAKNAGLQLGAGLAEGIYGGASQAIEAASWLASQVESAMRVQLDIHSPSGVARMMGGFFSEGFAQGLEGGISRVEQAANKIASAAAPSALGSAQGRQARVTINLDGKPLAQALAPLMDEALGENSWNG